jgi:hypothetical protein
MTQVTPDRPEVQAYITALRLWLRNKQKPLQLFNYVFRYSFIEKDETKLKLGVAFKAIYGADAKKEDRQTGGRFYTLASALRVEIKAFEKSAEGQRLAVHCDFPEAEAQRYQMSFHTEGNRLMQFWKPYLDNVKSDGTKRPWLALYTENVFFRPVLHDDREGRYFIRHLDVNSMAEDIRSKCEFLNHDSKAASFHTNRHFVSSGDVRCLLGLCQWFERMDVPTNFVPASDYVFPDQEYQYEIGWQQFKGSNLIVTGNPRTFPFTAFYLRRENFRFHVGQAGTCDKKQPSLASNDQDLFHKSGSARGVLNRIRLRDHNIWITAILSNHARFIEAALQFLINEDEMGKIIDSLPPEVAFDTDFPDQFELHLEATVKRDNDLNPLKKYDLHCIGAAIGPQAD